MIYLDSAATTPIEPDVAKEMYTFITTEYGNPSAKYYSLAENAKSALNIARDRIASLITCDSDELIFTSCASESNNFIIKGIADTLQDKGKHIITSTIEHKSVLETCKYLESKGYEVTYLKVDTLGRINVEELKNEIRKDTILVSIMWGNNEIGTLNDIEIISDICNVRNVLFHTDATQVLGKIKIDTKKLKVDFMSFSAHKIYGPKGIGACFIKNDEYGLKPELTPLIHGGGQEFGLRSGTHSMHNIVGFGKACDIARKTMAKYIPEILYLEEYLKTALLKNFPKIKFNGDQKNKIPGILSLSLEGLNNELFIKMVKDEIAISTGSACSLGRPSYVLKEIGSGDLTKNTIRVSLNKFSDKNCTLLVNRIAKYLNKFSI